MQFHLNGFRPGDPEISKPAEHDDGPRPLGNLPAEVDVLVIGCGPAGLTLAAQLAAFPEINTRIVEQKSGPLLLGQADGIACRTVEMFHAFGFSERLLKEACWINETTFWKPDDSQRSNIVRSGRVQDVEDGLSEFPHVVLNQARVHDFYLQVMRNAPNRLEPDYARRVIDLQIDPAASSGASTPTHPVTVKIERIDSEQAGQVETVKARYVVGCDGARSVVRPCLGRALHGDSANQAWGVMDVLAVTDFPDIRMKAAIQSANEGSVLIIPREGGYLVRIYVELDKLKEDERIASRNITVDYLIAAAQRILRPYTLEVKEIPWWSVYEIGQRLCDKFDDVPEEQVGTRSPHVFIAGDACHTHSPKAGQGMNVSMQDSFNLGWKLASVLRGWCPPQFLHTYSAERQAVAKELIDFDREFAKLFSDPPKDAADAGSEGVDLTEFQKYFVKQGRFTAGTETRYRPSIICGKPTYQHLAKGLVIGMRFHSAPVIRLADAKPVHLGHTVKADGRWRVFAFCGAGDPSAGSSGINSLCDFLARSEESPVNKYTPSGADIDAVIDVRAIFQQGHRELAIEAMQSFLLPRKGRYGLHDYEKVFCPDLKGGDDIFAMRGIDRDKGCMVVVRPDQYVAHIFPLDAYTELAAFFDGFMKHDF
ncbi:MAG TPA: FAD-binding monooxygenase [Mesorhizobium sp.]|nr:FAD-binding monooxygenase [Mesorhizobium sp.]